MSENTSSLFRGERNDRAEIVIGLVGAMGTDMERMTQELHAALLGVAYRVDTVRVSSLINDFFEVQGVEIPESETNLDALMDLGDALRLGLGHGGAAAALAVGWISRQRHADGAGVEREAFASIVRQLKHPAEVELLRSIYGPRFVLVGVWSPEEEREADVDRRLREHHPGQQDDWYARHVKRLLIRDEKDTSEPLGQRVRDTYELADAFIALPPGRQSAGEAVRLVNLLFGSPYETPTRAEQAMYMAAGASLRSSDAGRQVGAVVIDGDGEVVVTGTNEIPKPGGGQYWVGDDPDFRDFMIGYDENARQKLAIITDLITSLQAQEWLDPAKSGRPEELARDALAPGGPLAKNRVGDLLEFARVAHAEMAAICTAARRGTAIGGLEMYTTTYPCHECARLIIAAGIARLVYVDPYPKSQVRAMFRHEVSEAGEGGPGVPFESYRGIAPRLYRSVFTMTGRERRPVTGEYESWNPETSLPRLVAASQILNPIVETESGLIEPVFAEMGQVQWAEAISKVRLTAR